MLSVRKEVERCKVGVGDESGPCPTVQCYRVYLLYPMTVTAGPHSRVTVPLH